MLKKEWDLRWKIFEESTPEGCPNCSGETEVSVDGTTPCQYCGHKDVLPCSLCSLYNEGLCDWNEKTRCTPFPK